MALGLGGTIAAGLITGTGLSVLGSLFEEEPEYPTYPEPAKPPWGSGTTPLAPNLQPSIMQASPRMQLPAVPTFEPARAGGDSYKRLYQQYMAMGGFGA